jgi:DNA-binding NtrC family response regulator
MTFEENRRKILYDLRRQKSIKRAKLKAHNFSHTSSVGDESHIDEKSERTTVVIFGEKGPFLNNFISALSNLYTVSHFTDVDKAVDYMMDNGVKYLIIDIDPPSDYHQGVNLFTVASSVSSEIKIIICSSDKEDSRARSLSDHGCIVLQKPISIPEVAKYIG